jgi:hypothetical protein
MSQKHSFSIAQTEDPATDRPFGDKYGGPFVVRRPSLTDKRDIAVREQAYLCGVNPAIVDRDVTNQAFIFAHLDVLCEKDGRPDWCHPSKMYEGEDERALLAVWQEVDRFLKPFRAVGGRQAGE